MMVFPKIFFVTGTDTGVGKTFISALLTLGLKGSYWKPIQTGAESDREWIALHTQLPKEHFFPERYALKKALSPHLAAKEEGLHLGLSDFDIPSFAPFPHLIIEGCGGVLVPINEKHYLLDLIEKWRLPTLVVARNILGTINHTLLTIQELRLRSLPIVGVILNGERQSSNKETIEEFTQVPVLAEIGRQEEISKENLQTIFSRSFY